MEPEAYRCLRCGLSFETKGAHRSHVANVHAPHRKLRSKDRPRNRGAVPCGICDMTFGSPLDAEQHRAAKHGIFPIERTLDRIIKGGN